MENLSVKELLWSSVTPGRQIRGNELWSGMTGQRALELAGAGRGCPDQPGNGVEADETGNCQEVLMA